MVETSAQALHPRIRLGGYWLERVLGRGGMGTVFLARSQSGQRFAVKQISDTTDQGRLQFRREAELLARLSHPHLVTYHDFIEVEERQYLVMDYVEGLTLAEKMNLRDRPFPVGQVLEWALQLCRLLEYLHGQNPPVLYRDLKPANIMVDAQDRLTLIDLGLARSFTPDTPTEPFLRGVGSQGYAPLEQYSGSGGTDPRSDLYSLGATLYHLLTGQAPPDPIEVLALRRKRVPLRDWNPLVPLWLEPVIDRLLAIQPGERYESAQAVGQALARLADRLTEMERATELLPEHPPAPRRRPRALVAGLVAVSLLVGAGLSPNPQLSVPSTSSLPFVSQLAAAVPSFEMPRLPHPLPELSVFRSNRARPAEPVEVKLEPAQPAAVAVESVTPEPLPTPGYPRSTRRALQPRADRPQAVAPVIAAVLPQAPKEQPKPQPGAPLPPPPQKPPQVVTVTVPVTLPITNPGQSGPITTPGNSGPIKAASATTVSVASQPDPTTPVAVTTTSDNQPANSESQPNQTAASPGESEPAPGSQAEGGKGQSDNPPQNNKQGNPNSGGGQGNNAGEGQNNNGGGGQPPRGGGGRSR
ncbi:MAG: serine/threonine protein kinase [Vulcanimicrobiota bacterium]